MSNKKDNILEKDVLKSCMHYLCLWKMKKVVIDYQRTNSGMIQMGGHYIKLAKTGTPDIVCYWRHHGICYVLFVECKKPRGGKQSPAQKEFENTFKLLPNVHYLLCNDSYMINKFFEDKTQHTETILKQADEAFK